jgi:CRISPR-associated protein Csd1
MSPAWIHHYRSIDLADEKNGKVKKKNIPFIGAPAPKDIVFSAFGEKADSKLFKATILRILPVSLKADNIREI